MGTSAPRLRYVWAIISRSPVTIFCDSISVTFASAISSQRCSLAGITRGSPPGVSGSVDSTVVVISSATGIDVELLPHAIDPPLQVAVLDLGDDVEPFPLQRQIP